MATLTLLTLMIGLFGSRIAAQSYSSGAFGLGVRSTLNIFPTEDGGMTGVGAGGHFRIGFADRVNTEWFMDYIQSRGDLGFRTDYHVGWSVQFALGSDFSEKRVTPYILGGQCFDLTKVRGFTTGSESPLVFSSAAQAGLGLSSFLRDNVEINFQTQYMFHLSRQLELVDDGSLATHYHESRGFSFLGHVLINFGVSFYILDFKS